MPFAEQYPVSMICPTLPGMSARSWFLLPNHRYSIDLHCFSDVEAEDLNVYVDRIWVVYYTKPCMGDWA